MDTRNSGRLSLSASKTLGFHRIVAGQIAVETEGVKVWVLPVENMKGPFPVFRKRCANVGITGVYFEDGSRLVCELLHTHELEYHFNYTAPIMMGDDKAKPVYRGLRAEKLSQCIRLEGLSMGSSAMVN